jgi:hypothetical protein
MRRRTAFGFAAWAAWMLLAAPALGEADDQDQDLEVRWSLSPIIQYHAIESPEDDNGVTGFFDQYEFVPNKSSSFPVQIGIGDAELDFFREQQTPLFQVRLDSPTSNLGISGSEADDPFLNQRGLVLGRYRPLDFDLRYWRMRTEELRLFPNTAEGALVFNDLTRPDDRFYRDRTGFRSEIRSDLGVLLGDRASVFGRLGAPQLSLRGGFESRDGRRQRRFLFDPANRWTGLSQRHDQDVGEIGAGVLLTPWRLLTVSIDFDYESFRENENPLLRGQLGGGAPASQTIGFVPNTDRYNGTVLLRSRLGERAVVEAGIHSSYLKQVDEFTPMQRSAGLRDNRLLYTSANLTADVAIFDSLSANAFVKFEQRDNDIDQSTALYNPSNGTQVDEFIHRWRRWLGGLEGLYRFNAANRMAVGARFESIDRDLEFAQPGLGFLRINPANALVSESSNFYEFYTRAQLRLARRINLMGEVGYRYAPKTGYVIEPDDRTYGKLRASYTLPLEKPVFLSLFARGETGDGDTKRFVAGVGDNPAGPLTSQEFERDQWLWGLTASLSPSDTVSVFGSFFMSRNSQDYDLVLSSVQRYVQPVVPVTFTKADDVDYQDERLSLLLGAHLDLSEQSDASLSYSYTRSEVDYSGGLTPELSLLSRYRGIEADIHGLDLEVGHWLRAGLRVMAGYGFRYYDDGSARPASVASVVPPFDLTTTRHVVRLGVTLTSDLLGD